MLPLVVLAVLKASQPHTIVTVSSVELNILQRPVQTISLFKSPHCMIQLSLNSLNKIKTNKNIQIVTKLTVLYNKYL